MRVGGKRFEVWPRCARQTVCKFPKQSALVRQCLQTISAFTSSHVYHTWMMPTTRGKRIYICLLQQAGLAIYRAKRARTQGVSIGRAVFRVRQLLTPAISAALARGVSRAFGHGVRAQITATKTHWGQRTSCRQRARSSRQLTARIAFLVACA